MLALSKVYLGWNRWASPESSLLQSAVCYTNEIYVNALFRSVVSANDDWCDIDGRRAVWRFVDP